MSKAFASGLGKWYFFTASGIALCSGCLLFPPAAFCLLFLVSFDGLRIPEKCVSFVFTPLKKRERMAKEL